MSADTLETPNWNWGRWLGLIGLLLAAGLGWYFGYANLVRLVRGAEPAPLIAMGALILAGFLIRAWKWRLALGAGQQGVLLFFIAKTAGNWTPGRAGELAPLLLKRHRNARVAAWIGLDRVVEVAWTLGLGLIGAASLGLVSPSAWVVLGAGGAVILAVLALLSRRTRRAARPVSFRAIGRWSARLRHGAARVYEELLLFRRKLPAIMALTFAAKVTDIYAVILLCEAFGYGAGFLVVCAARCAHGLVSAIPVTPDATGIPFIAAAWLLHEHADIPYDTLTAALALEVIAINAILWACFCLASAGWWNPIKTGKPSP